MFVAPSSGRKATTSASSAPARGTRAAPTRSSAAPASLRKPVDVRERHRHHVVLARPPGKGVARLGVEAAQEDGGEQAREFGERHRARILRVGDLGTRRARRRSDGARRRVGKAADMRCVERESQRQRHHTPGGGGAQSARAPRRQRQTSPGARQRCEAREPSRRREFGGKLGPRRHVRRRPAQRRRRAADLPRRGPPRTRREASRRRCLPRRPLRSGRIRRSFKPASFPERRRPTRRPPFIVRAARPATPGARPASFAAAGGAA